MIIDTEKLQSVSSWAREFDRGNGRRGVALTYAHHLLDPKNVEPVARRVQEEWSLILIDGVKFVIRIDDLQKPKKTNLKKSQL